MSSVSHAQSKARTQQSAANSFLGGISEWLPDQDLFGNAHIQGSVAAQEESGWLDGRFGAESEQTTASAMVFPLLGLLGGCPERPTSPDPALDQALDDLSGRSPAFAEALAKVDRSRIRLGKEGDGSANLPDGSIQIDPERLGDPAVLYRSLAHEIGHAVQPDIRWHFDPTMTRQQYIDANTDLNLENEAEALMMELAVRDDLLSGTRPIDIGASGSTSKQKLALYERYKAGEIDREAMIEGAAMLIGTEKPSKTEPGVDDYVDHYGRAHTDAWDASHSGGTP